MDKGHDYVHRLNEVVSTFEESVVNREHKQLLESKVSLQQAVDRARHRLVKTVVDMVTEARLEKEPT